MKILITGGGGYIGSVLVEKLLDWWVPTDRIMYGSGGERVMRRAVDKLTVVDNMVRKQNTLGRFCSDTRFEFIKSDCTEPFKYKLSTFDKEMEIDVDELICTNEYDVVIPLAGVVGAPRCQANFHQAWRLNQAQLENMIDMIMEHSKNPPKIIYPCTNSGYGSRPDGKFVTEQDELNPVSVYGQSKVAAEKNVLDYGGVSLRLATVMGYSPCMRLDLLVNDFTWKGVNDRYIVLYEKHFKRNYIHVQDVAQAFILAIQKYDEMQGQSYNVGLSSANLSKFELAQIVQKHTGCELIEAPYMEDPDKRDYLVSNEKIEAMGFCPDWTVDDTVYELVKFYNTITLDSANVFYENWR
jgi:nucleoside-diphosphate-sugar epimerase